MWRCTLIGGIGTIIAPGFATLIRIGVNVAVGSAVDLSSRQANNQNVINPPNQNSRNVEHSAWYIVQCS